MTTTADVTPGPTLAAVGHLRDLLSRAGSGPLSVHDLPRDVPGARMELIDGCLTLTPIRDAGHHALITQWSSRLARLVPDDLQVISAVAVLDGRGTLLEPDLAVVDPRRIDVDAPGVTPASLRVVIEVTCPSSRRYDLTVKRDLLRQWGVPSVVVDRSTDPHTLHLDGQLPEYARHLVLDAL